MWGRRWHGANTADRVTKHPSLILRSRLRIPMKLATYPRTVSLMGFVRSCMALFAATVLLQGCAATDATIGEKRYSVAQTQAMLVDAFNHVQHRYIDPVGMDELAMAGLNRLTAVDNRLSIQRKGGQLILLADSRIVEEYTQPDRPDSLGWAEVSAEIVDKSRSNSTQAASLVPEDLYSTLMGGIVATLDRYSRYESAKVAKSQRAGRTGFGGIGATIRTRDGTSTIVETLPEMPAAAAGLKAGDVIIRIDDEPIAGQNPIDVIGRLRGPIGKIVIVDVRRDGEADTRRFSIRRAHVVPRSVRGMLKNGVAQIILRGFNRRSSADLEDEIAKLQAQAGGKLRGIVLDLRNNPGGLFDQALSIADLFLDRGLIIRTRGRHPAANKSFQADGHQIAKDVPLAVIINGRSASSSEILAAALQSHSRAIVVGSGSHGKGSVQSIRQLPNSGELIVTWSRIFSPSGYLLDGLGVIPNICTSASPDVARAGRSPSARAFTDAKQFSDWNRYDRADEELAQSLRRYCPPEPAAPKTDMSVAMQLLADPKAYRTALVQTRQSATRGIQAQSLQPS